MLLILSIMTRLSQNYLSLTEECVHCRPCCWSLSILDITSQTGLWRLLRSEYTRGCLLAAPMTLTSPPRQSPAPGPEVRAARTQQQRDHVLKQELTVNYHDKGEQEHR